MTTNREGMAGAFDILHHIDDPEEYEPGMIPEIRRILTDLAQKVIALGNLANRIETERRKVQELFDEGNMGLASSTALEYMDRDRVALQEIATAMRGKVRVGNPFDDPRYGSPDSPEANSNDGHTIKAGEE